MNSKGIASKGIASKGIAFILVLGFILAVVITANVALIFMSSQARLSHHQFSRIRALYAAQAGTNFALEQLRLGNWDNTGSPYCLDSPNTGPTCDHEDDEIPYYVQIVISDFGPDGVRTIDVTADYSY